METKEINNGAFSTAEKLFNESDSQAVMFVGIANDGSPTIFTRGGVNTKERVLELISLLELYFKNTNPQPKYFVKLRNEN
jgi:hypothetical protein